MAFAAYGPAPSPSPKPAPKPNRPRQAILAALVALVLLGSVAHPAQEHLRAAGMLLCIGHKDHSFISNFETVPVSVEATTVPVDGKPVEAKLYRPVGIEHPSPVVLLHGVHHLGIEEPRLVNFARALASRGYLVLTPLAADLADYHVTGYGAQVIGESALEMCSVAHTSKVSVIGMSFGGGLALIAASNPRYSGSISSVVALGSHEDLGRVLQYFVSNRAEGPHGEVFAEPAHEYGPLVAMYQHPEAFFPAADVEQARISLRYLLWEDVEQSKVESAKLSPAAQRVMQILYEHKVQDFGPTMMAWIAQHPHEWDAASPSHAGRNVHVPVFLLCGAADNIVPPTETLWIEHDLPADTDRHVLISNVLSHLDVSKASVLDQARLVHWMAEMLDEERKNRAADSR
ncbi:MAG TPA: alpha/beta fold hydrolase [candidate division Zixibacteria bacterium]|nr:alpha/beta fold hydrolase [candidate division Zixibacteria bacterium]